MNRRKRVSLMVQVDIDSDESREEALSSVTERIRGALADKPGVVRRAVDGVADFIPTEEQLREIGVGGGSRGF